MEKKSFSIIVKKMVKKRINLKIYYYYLINILNIFINFGEKKIFKISNSGKKKCKKGDDLEEKIDEVDFSGISDK